MFQRYCLHTPRRKITFAVPKLIRLQQIVFADYVGEGKELGLVEEYIKSMRGQRRFDVFKSPDNHRSIVIIVAVEKAEYERLCVLINNIPDKVAALYGNKEKTEYVKEADAIMNVFSEMEGKG